MTDTVEIEQFGEYLARVIDDFERVDFTKTLNRMADQIQLRIDQNFLTETTGGNIPWPVLAPSTIKRKGHSIKLVDSTRLKRSSLEQTNTDHVQMIEPSRPAFLVYGTSVEYAKFHQDGTSRIPQREFMSVSDRTVDAMADTVADGIVEELKK